MNKRGLEFSFAWIFSMIVGAVIIFIAIYATTQYISTTRQGNDAQVTEQVGIILEKVETSLEESSLQQIEFPGEARIYNKCIESGTFGRQGISVSTRSGVGKEWQLPSTEKVFYDKYLFSSDVVEGKEINVFVKKLELPYEVADLVLMYSDDYCFVNAPGDVEDEVNKLSLESVELSPSVSSCSAESVSVCFTGAGCDVVVDQVSGRVTKGRTVLNYGGEEALLYASIFSDENIYECQVKRIMKRTAELAQIYALKAELLDARGCGSGLSTDLRSYSSSLGSVQSSTQLNSVSDAADEIWRKNERLSCKLF